MASTSRQAPVRSSRPTCDPWQHSLQDFSPGSANDHAHQVLLLLHSEVLSKQGPELLLLSLDMLLQGGPHGSAHALQLVGMLAQLLKAAVGLDLVKDLQHPTIVGSSESRSSLIAFKEAAVKLVCQ